MQQFAQIGFPELYERELVKPLFEPWAQRLVRALDLAPDDRFLDVACGTGIVARIAQTHIDAASSVVGVDVNPAMLEVARRIAPDIDWRSGDAATLPVTADEQFDAIACQQGLQFFPDRDRAAAEMRRVLAPGGRLAVSTWRSDDEMPVLRELRAIAEQRVGPINDRRHSLARSDELEQLLQRVGFRDVRVEANTQTIRFSDGSAFVFLNAMALVGMSAGARDLTDEARAELVNAITADSQQVIDANSDHAGFAYEIGANIAMAAR
jgi:ubiquinone/menaquinone biosynthesis C-methylase UbiE